MIYLFVHQNFPGQYKLLIQHLVRDPGNTVYFITQKNRNEIRGVRKLVYEPAHPADLNCHPLARDFDQSIRNGVHVADACRTLAREGVRPDIVIGHNGWGEMTFVKEVFPDTPVLLYFEFYYHSRNADVGFDPEHPGDASTGFLVRARNAINLLSMEAADWGNSPTAWQRSVQPPEVRPRISVVHEGVDTRLVRPNPQAQISLQRDGLTLTRRDEVITYVARNLEPYRGFHVFMRAARLILERRPRAHIVLVGGDEVSYGAPAPPGKTWRQVALEELGPALDLSRIHFLGQVPYESYLQLLAVSSAHVYLTYPFVLSWSFIEAMASGCAVVGSATAPVLEVLRDRENGLLVDFFSPTQIADRVDELLGDPVLDARVRAGARATAVSDFDFATVTLPRWTRLFADLIAGRRPDLYVPLPVAPAPRTAGPSSSASARAAGG